MSPHRSCSASWKQTGLQQGGCFQRRRGGSGKGGIRRRQTSRWVRQAFICLPCASSLRFSWNRAWRLRPFLKPSGVGGGGGCWGVRSGIAPCGLDLLRREPWVHRVTDRPVLRLGFWAPFPTFALAPFLGVGPHFGHKRALPGSVSIFFWHGSPGSVLVQAKLATWSRECQLPVCRSSACSSFPLPRPTHILNSNPGDVSWISPDLLLPFKHSFIFLVAHLFNLLCLFPSYLVFFYFPPVLFILFCFSWRTKST